MVIKRSNRYIAVDPVPFLCFRILCNILSEDRWVIIQVKSQFRIVEICILLDLGIEIHDRGILESLHRRYLILRLNIAESKVIVSNLSDRVCTHRNHIVILDGSLIILDGIKQ